MCLKIFFGLGMYWYVKKLYMVFKWIFFGMFFSVNIVLILELNVNWLLLLK